MDSKEQRRNNEHRRPTSLRRIWLFRIVMLVVSAVFCFIVLELAARAMQLAKPYHPQAKTAIALYYENPNDTVLLTPNWEGYVSGVWTQINSDGFRDKQITPMPAEGVLRIAALGDSYTMGDGVTLEDSYPKQLERLLAANEDACEVLNCGVSSTNSIQQLGTLRTVIEQYHPQKVILALNVNDFEIPTKTRFDRLRKSGFEFEVGAGDRVTLKERRKNGAQKIKAAFRSRSYLIRFLSNMGAAANPAASHAERIQEYVAQGKDQTLASVKAMHDLCVEKEVSFTVFVIPGLLNTSTQMRNMSDYPHGPVHRQICDELTLLGVVCVDLQKVFDGCDLDKLIVHRLDRHYNRDGNALVADAMQSYLKWESAGKQSIAEPFRSLQLKSKE